MDTIRIRGGYSLEGELEILGAKNSVLPILAGTVLFRDGCCIAGCPELTDVDAACRILRHLGVPVTREGRCIHTGSPILRDTVLPRQLMSTMRSSVLFLGPLLARTGTCTLYHPGGCCLGDRPIDLHLKGLEQMGICCTWEGERLTCRGKLRGAPIVLPYPSVGATENLMMAALGARGITTIYNAAREPEIADLAAFLNRGGGRVFGAGTSMIQIEGGLPNRADFTVMPDRMEAATYLAAAASAGGDVLLRSLRPEQLRPVTGVLTAAGCRIDTGRTTLRLRRFGRLKAAPPIRTAPYPGFPTDAQAPVMAALLRSRGTTMFEENIFSDRFRHVPALRAMGADIWAAGHLAVVRGTDALHGACVEATDLRGGAAMAVAALAAEGESRIAGLNHLLRGYENFSHRLECLGAKIETVSEP